MKLFRIRGGVHPEDRKALSADCAIEPVALPELLRIPLQQHIGAPAEPVVRKGDTVKKGQLLAVGQGLVSAPVHAPTSGRVMAIGRYHAPHPSGLPGRTVTLKPDGEDAWGDLPAPIEDPFKAEPETIAKRVAESGIVGMGGATFPSAVKLNLRDRYAITTLLINGAECEPYLTCDDRLMRERTEQVLDGIRLMAHALGATAIIIAVEKNKPRALAALTAAAAPYGAVTVAGVPTRYPMGSEKHLVQVVTGKETPARALTADIGVVVHNVATAFAVHEAVRFGRPLVSRIVTMSGGAIAVPKNLEVPIGTPFAHLIDRCGGTGKDLDRLLLGGPMMGQPLSNTKAPIIKGTNGLLALSTTESRVTPARPCIRCATCVSVCPCGLVPLEMAARIRKEELDAAVGWGLLDCVGCGSCAYACPAHIPLVQFFNYAKGQLTHQQRSKHKQEETKRLAEARTKRQEEAARAKREAMAKRKAERAAKKAAAEKAASATEQEQASA